MSPLIEMLRSSRIQLSAWLMLLIIPIATSAQEHSTRNKGMASVGLYARSYFYASMKVSIEDLATYAFASEGEADDYKTKEGLILDFGYGKQLNKYVGIEGGVEAYFLNPLQVIYDHEQDEGYDALDVQSRAYSLQLRPYFHVALGEEASLRIGTGLIYQQLHSSGKYYLNREQAETKSSSMVLKSSYRSRLMLNYVPFTALDFSINEKWALSFELSYVSINWNKSLEGLRFHNQPGLQLPDHRTSTVFLGARVAFK